MIFTHTWQSVVAGAKTQTRRLAHSADRILGPEASIKIVQRKGRTLYYVGQRLAVQTGRGERGIATIQVERIRREPVSDITAADIRAEGFSGKGAMDRFRDLWRRMHGAQALRQVVYVLDFKLLSTRTR